MVLVNDHISYLKCEQLLLFPGPVYGPSCTVSGLASSAVSGVSQSVRIQAADQYGNALASGSPAFVAAFSPSSGTSSTLVSPNDGSTTLQYRLSTVGTSSLALTLSGSPIASSPFSIAVTPGEKQKPLFS
jgi:hypothetical protein